MPMPCEKCVIFAMCNLKNEISCDLVDDWVFLHDVDPGFRGAYARAIWIKEFFELGRVILDKKQMTVIIDGGILKHGVSL